MGLVDTMQNQENWFKKMNRHLLMLNQSKTGSYVFGLTRAFTIVNEEALGRHL
jgi:hypothetical protein